MRYASAGDLDFVTQLGVTLLPDFHLSSSDFSCVFALDPTTFYVGELNNEIISHINTVKYPGHSTFISTFVVAEKHRGKGYGKKTWDAAWNDLDKSITIGLDGVTEMVPKYESLGFCCVWNVAVVEIDPEMISTNFASISHPPGITVKPINTIDISKVIEYDASVFGVSRERFIQAWITIPGSRGWVAVDERSNLVGYAAVRPVISEVEKKWDH